MEAGKTYAMMVQMEDSFGVTDYRDDSFDNVEELTAYARREVPRLAQQHWQYEQFPMFQLNGHDFPITRARR